MQVRKVSIREWAKDDRPREKLLSKTPVSLSDAELLAILIGTGIPSIKGAPASSALDLAREILKLGKNSLIKLGKIPVREFMKIKGIGEAKAITIAAALELGRRREAQSHLDLLAARRRPRVRNSREVASYCQALLRDHPHEVFAVIFLNQAGTVLDFEIVSKGGISGTVVDPRLILKRALQENAVSLIICHNHPSGSLKPSLRDKELTFKLKEAAKYMDINLLDHVIVSEEGAFSFADEGLI